MFSHPHNSVQSFKSYAYANTVKPILDGDSDYTFSLCTNAPKPFIFLICIDMNGTLRQIYCPKPCLDFMWSFIKIIQVGRSTSLIFHIIVLGEIRQNPLGYMEVLIPDSRGSQHLPIWAATMPYPLWWQHNFNLVFWPCFRLNTTVFNYSNRVQGW